MAVRFESASAEYFKRTTSLPNFNATYTAMGWFSVVSFTQFGYFFVVGDAAATNYDGLSFRNTLGDLRVFNNVATVNSGQRLVVDTWVHLAMVRESATSQKLYVGGALTDTNTGSVGTSRTGGIFDVGSYENVAATVNLNGRVAAIKVWDAALTLDEIKSELPSVRPQRLTSLNAWYPGFPGSGERARDYSGGGRDWTEVGTLSDEDPPPLSYGAPLLWLPYVAAAGGGATQPPRSMHQFRMRGAA